METTPPISGADPQPPPSRTLEQLFHALETPLLAYAMRLTRQPEAAEDCVQEAFLRLQPRLAAGEVQEPRAWLYRTIHNLAMSGHRAARRVVPFEAPTQPNAASTSTETPLSPAETLADPRPLPDDEVERHEAAGLTRLVLDRLEKSDPRAARLVRLKFNDSLSYKEIAERTGLTVGNVGYLLHHALKTLAVELASAGLTP